MPLTGVTDYSPYVTALQSSGANLAVFGVSLTQSVALQAAVKASGYTGAGVDYQSYNPGLLTAEPSLDQAEQGEYVDVQIPPQESNTPAIRQAEKDLVASPSAFDAERRHPMGLLVR